MPKFTEANASEMGRRGGKRTSTHRDPVDRARHAAQQATPEMMRVLTDIAAGREKPDGGRIQAAIRVLEYGMGKAIPAEKPKKEAAPVPTSENLFTE